MTYSITGWCSRTKQVGFAMASFDVGFAPPTARFSAVSTAGAVTCQATTHPGFGDKVMERLAAGKAAAEALEDALQGEDGSEVFQVCVLDSEGRAAAFTGSETTAWKGHRTGEHCAAAGNILAGSEVVETMVAAFQREHELDLPERLLTALAAGRAAGGDRRGTRGGTLWVASDALPFGGIFVRLHHHERVLPELRRALAVAREETDFAATARRAAEALLPLLDEEDVRQRLGELSTLEAVGRLRRELSGKVPDETLLLLERVERHLQGLQSGQGRIPFRLTLYALNIILATPSTS